MKKTTDKTLRQEYMRIRSSALQYTLWAMNSRPNDLVIGLSGMTQLIESDSASHNPLSKKRQEEIIKYVGLFGRVIYCQILEHGWASGDIGIDFRQRQIYSPAMPAQFAPF